MGSRGIPASRQTAERIEDLLAGGGDHDARSDLIRRGVRKLVEEVLEAEVEDRLGRAYYGRGDGERPGYRNGYRRGRLKSAEGAIEYAVPQVSDLGEPYRSRVRERLGGRTEELERLAVEMYARGLSTRDIESTFADEHGRSLLSRTAVSEVTERLWEEDEAFATRGLSEHQLLYLFVDDVAERLRPGLAREAVLCAWGIDQEGKKVLLALSPGTKEDTESCRTFFQDMRRGGLGDPLLVVTDRRARADAGGRGVLPAQSSSTLPRPSDAKPGGEGARASVARGTGSRQSRVRGPITRGQRPAGRLHHAVRA